MVIERNATPIRIGNIPIQTRAMSGMAALKVRRINEYSSVDYKYFVIEAQMQNVPIPIKISE